MVFKKGMAVEQGAGRPRSSCNKTNKTIYELQAASDYLEAFARDAVEILSAYASRNEELCKRHNIKAQNISDKISLDASKELLKRARECNVALVAAKEDLIQRRNATRALNKEIMAKEQSKPTFSKVAKLKVAQ